MQETNAIAGQVIPDPVNATTKAVTLKEAAEAAQIFARQSNSSQWPDLKNWGPLSLRVLGSYTEQIRQKDLQVATRVATFAALGDKRYSDGAVTDNAGRPAFRVENPDLKNMINAGAKPGMSFAERQTFTSQLQLHVAEQAAAAKAVLTPRLANAEAQLSAADRAVVTTYQAPALDLVLTKPFVPAAAAPAPQAPAVRQAAPVVAAPPAERAVPRPRIMGASPSLVVDDADPAAKIARQPRGQWPNLDQMGGADLAALSRRAGTIVNHDFGAAYTALQAIAARPAGSVPDPQDLAEVKNPAMRQLLADKAKPGMDRAQQRDVLASLQDTRKAFDGANQDLARGHDADLRLRQDLKKQVALSPSFCAASAGTAAIAENDYAKGTYKKVTCNDVERTAQAFRQQPQAASGAAIAQWGPNALQDLSTKYQELSANDLNKARLADLEAHPERSYAERRQADAALVQQSKERDGDVYKVIGVQLKADQDAAEKIYEQQQGKPQRIAGQAAAATAG